MANAHDRRNHPCLTCPLPDCNRAELDSNKRRRQQMYLKGFRTARDLAIQVVETADSPDPSLVVNAIRAIHPPTKVRHKPEVKP